MPSALLQGGNNPEMPRPPAPVEERLAIRWADLLGGHADSSTRTLNAAESRFVAWASSHLEAGQGHFAATAPPVIEPLCTTGFMGAIATLQGHMDRVRELFQLLQNAEIDFTVCMTRISQMFQGDESRWLQWKILVDDLPRFRRWLPGFEAASRYLSDAFPTPLEPLQNLRKGLAAAIADPQRFLDPAAREAFDRDFAEFREGYADYYYAAHEDSVHIVGNPERMESRLDAVTLRNLELLSELDGADRSCLNRARAVGKWLQAQQCNLPVREILKDHPRCYCNFNPMERRRLSEAVDLMAATIIRGIEHFRAILRNGRIVIIRELETLAVDDACSRPIAALLSRGPMVSLNQKAISVLNTVLRKHPEAFAPAPHVP